MLRLLTTIGVVLWLVVGMIELVSLAPSPINNTPVASKETNNECAETNNKHSFLGRIFFCKTFPLFHGYRDDINALSTFFIMIFTGVLSFFNTSLAKSTRIAANAARDAASIIPNLERAFVYIDDMVPAVGEPEKDIDKRTREVIDRVKDSSIYISFINRGRTPANIASIVAFADFLDHIPSESDDERILALLTATERQEIVAIIGSDKTWGFRTWAATKLTFQAMPGLIRGEINMYCWGKLEYRDIFGRTHPTHFCRRLTFPARDIHVCEPVGGFDRNKSE